MAADIYLLRPMGLCRGQSRLHLLRRTKRSKFCGSPSSWNIGTSTELANKIDPDGSEGIVPKKEARQILKSVEVLRKAGIAVSIRRSNGKRLIELRRADSADFSGKGRNLNQLTTLANMGRLTVLRGDRLIDKYTDLCAAIHRLTKEVD